MKIKTLFSILTLALGATFCPAKGLAQTELGTPASDGSNATITIKPLVRLWRVQFDRDGNIELYCERLKTNNADGTQVGEVVKLKPITRSLAYLVANSPASPPSGNREQVTVTLGGQPVNITFAQWLLFLDAFRAKWATETPPIP